STVTVTDVPLTARPVAISAVEGSSFAGTVATFTDENPNAVTSDFTATITWGDGSTSTGTITANGGSFTVTGAHTYAEEGSFSTYITITDRGGSNDAVFGGATVGDGALTTSGLSFGTWEGFSLNTPALIFNYTDSNAAVGDFSATINWGDGTTSAGWTSTYGTNGF